MNRRDSIKTITFASIGAGLLLEGCYGISSEKIKRSLTLATYAKDSLLLRAPIVILVIN